MALFGGACPHCDDYRQQRDRAQAELSAVLTEQAALVRDAMAMKRHELGLPPAGVSMESPTSILGPKTKAAIETMSAGFSDQASYLTNWSITKTREALAEGEDAGSADQMIAHAIRQGDTE